MAIRFKVLGIDVSADSADDAVALLTKLSKAGMGSRAENTPSSKAVVTHERSWPLPTGSVLPQQDQAPSTANQATLPLAAQSADVRLRQKAELTLPFLRAVKAAGLDGMDTEAMMRVFQTSKPKGLGSKTGQVNDVLKSLGLDPDQVLTRTRIGNGKLFTAGPEIDIAISACADAVRG